MRKFLLPIINLVNVILVSITFGLAANPAATDTVIDELLPIDYYNYVWRLQEETNVLGIVGFFLFVFAVALTVVAFLPIKARKFITPVNGLMYIASGVLFLLTPSHYCYGNAAALEPTGSLIAMAVLVFVAGALSILMSVLEFTGKKDK